MQTDDKRNQIKSWWTTPNPPEPPQLLEPPQPSKVLMIWRGTWFLVTFVFFIAIVAGIYFERTPLEAIIATVGYSLFALSIILFILFCRWVIKTQTTRREIWFLVGVVVFGTFCASMESSVSTGFYFLGAIPTTIFVWAIIAVRKYYKAAAKYDEAYHEAEIKYDEAKAKYDEAAAKYDALPSINQMYQWLEEDFENIKMSSIKKTGLDESEIMAEPVLGRVPIRADGMPLSATDLALFWDLTVLYIGNLSIVLYRCEYHWGEDTLSRESTTEYFYQDMVAIEKSSVGFGEVINIRLRGGGSVKIALNGQESIDLSNRVDEAAQVIRQLLKDRKR